MSAYEIEIHGVMTVTANDKQEAASMRIYDADGVVLQYGTPQKIF